MGLHVWARLVRCRRVSPLDTSQWPSQAGMGSAQHASTHVQQGTHMLISGSPRCKRLGGGGREHSRAQAAAKIHWNLVPSRPPSPAVEVTIAGADTHPPTVHSRWAASFSRTSAREPSWGTAPHPLPPSWPPLPLVLSFTLPPSMGEEWGYVWAVSFPQSTGGLPLESVGMG